MNKDLIDLEENLILEEIRLEQFIIRDELTKKLNRAENLFNTFLPEIVNMRIESAESLSKNFDLPLKVRGVFLLEGRPKKRFYSAEELRKAVENPNNKRFPIKQDHRDGETASIVGVVERLEYDQNIQLKDGSLKPGIRFWGHINDETTARNVLDGVITDVSVTVYSDNEVFDEKLGFIGKGLAFSELSTVTNGSVQGNFIEPVRS